MAEDDLTWAIEVSKKPIGAKREKKNGIAKVQNIYPAP
jgi:hypothetical protein